MATMFCQTASTRAFVAQSGTPLQSLLSTLSHRCFPQSTLPIVFSNIRNSAKIQHPNAIINNSNNNAIRFYISRAHPKPKDLFAIPRALEILIQEAEERIEKRKKKAEIFEKSLNHPDETIEFVLQLNLDPRKPGQSLRGSVELPHGSGKKLQCIVFTEDRPTVEAALEQGAALAGGESLVDQIARGDVPVEGISRSLATSDMVPSLQKKVARLLGPRGLMPNVKTGSLYETNESLLEDLSTKIMGRDLVYRTEKEGHIMVPVGKVSFGVEKLLDNIGEVVKEIHAVKPEQYGKGKKKLKKTTKGTKYVLGAFLTTTQGRGLKLELRTIDPSGTYFLQDPTVERTFAKAA